MIKIGGAMRRFSFLVSDVSISSVYLLLQMPFWQLRYLQGLDIRFRRCSFLDRCICNLLFLWLADAFQPAYHVNCIYIFPFLGFEDTSFSNFTSASHVFYDLRILPIKILHLQFLKIHYRRYIRNACPAKFCSFVHQACNNVQTENKLDTFQWIW